MKKEVLENSLNQIDKHLAGLEKIKQKKTALILSVGYEMAEDPHKFLKRFKIPKETLSNLNKMDFEKFNINFSINNYLNDFVINCIIGIDGEKFIFKKQLTRNKK